MADDEVSSSSARFCFFFTRLKNTLILSLFFACLPQAKKAKQAEIDRKRAEVRKRMEEASKAKKAKKGFMTPDRKKKLRVSIIVTSIIIIIVPMQYYLYIAANDIAIN